MAVVSSFSKRLGSVVREIGRKKGQGGWYGPQMAAAERAIRERIPMVDLVVEVRDARIPFASTFEPARYDIHSNKHMIILNKMDLADCSLTEKQNHLCLGVNSHNNDSVKQLLNVVKKRTKDLKVGEIHDTATVLLVGIPNVGKSAIANSMHLVGRLDAAEKGKLKHATISPQPGETRDISSYKIASHPNIYVFDTPGVLSAEIADDDSGSKLALTGALKDSLIGECNLARYLLAYLSTSDVYTRWEGLNSRLDHMASSDTEKGNFVGSNQKRRRQYYSDHTQDHDSKVSVELWEGIYMLWIILKTYFFLYTFEGSTSTSPSPIFGHQKQDDWCQTKLKHISSVIPLKVHFSFFIF